MCTSIEVHLILKRYILKILCTNVKFLLLVCKTVNGLYKRLRLVVLSNATA